MLSRWLVGPSRPLGWLVGVVLLGFVLSGWVGLVFVRPGVMCLTPVRRRVCSYCDASMTPVLNIRRRLKAAGCWVEGLL